MIAEAWRRRKYEAAFVNKLNEAEGEAAETQVWVMHAVDCEYLSKAEARELHRLWLKRLPDDGVDHLPSARGRG